MSSSTTVTVSNATPVSTSPRRPRAPTCPGRRPAVGLVHRRGPNDTHTCTIDWGDGTPVDTGAVSESNGAAPAPAATPTREPRAAPARSSSPSPTTTPGPARLGDDLRVSLRAVAEAGRDRPRECADPDRRQGRRGQAQGRCQGGDASLDPTRWLDDTHLGRRRARRSSTTRRRPSRSWMDLLDGTTIPDSAIQPMIDDLLNADQFIAQTAIADAIAARGKPNEIAAAQKRDGKGRDRAEPPGTSTRPSTTTSTPGSTRRNACSRPLVGRGPAVAELQQPVGRDRRRACERRTSSRRSTPMRPSARPTENGRRARRWAWRALGHVSVYSGPEPSGGVRRPPLAVIAPHWTQFDGVTSTTTLPSPSSAPTS